MVATIQIIFSLHNLDFLKDTTIEAAPYNLTLPIKSSPCVTLRNVTEEGKPFAQ